MHTWKRWSWRYRVGALFALALLLQGSNCPLGGSRTFLATDPTYTVPGVGEVFRFVDIEEERGASYVIKEIDPSTGRYWRIYPGDPRYGLIAAYFGNLSRGSSNPPDRSSLPGGTGTPPPPPVQ